MANGSKWATISVTGLVSLLAGVASAVIIDYVRASALKLEYEILSSSTFSGQLQRIALLAIEISNPGRQTLENLSAQVTLPGGALIESKVESFPLKGLNEAKGTNIYSLEMPFLNPNEKGKIVLLYNLPEGGGTSPEVHLRAKGVKGTQKVSQAPAKFNSTITIWAAASAAMLVAMTLQGWLIRTDSHSGDQRHVAAFVLEQSGLTHEARALRQSATRDYWSISDEFTHLALEKNDAEHLRKVSHAFESLLDYAAIANSSRRIISFNLARIYVRLGDQDAAKAALDAARKRKDAVISLRLRLTPEVAALVKV